MPITLNTPKNWKTQAAKHCTGQLHWLNVKRTLIKDNEKAEAVPPSFPACQDRRDRPAQACSRWCQSECKYVSYRQGALVHLPTSAWHQLQMHPVVQLTKVRKGTNLLITKQAHRNVSLKYQIQNHKNLACCRWSPAVFGTAACRQICDKQGITELHAAVASAPQIFIRLWKCNLTLMTSDALLELSVLIISDLGTLSGISVGTTKQGGFGSITANTRGVTVGSW